MKSILKSILVLVCLSLLSCDDTFDFISQDNLPPVVYFKNEVKNVTFTDSLKLGATSTSGRTNGLLGKEFYEVGVSATDPEGSIGSLSYNVQTGSAKIFVGATELSGKISLESGSATIRIKPLTGLNTIVFQATDANLQGSTATLNLMCFKNLVPVAKVAFTNTKVDSPYEYEFDASRSYDADFNFGGLITQYEYVINDDNAHPIKSNKSVIKQILPGPGGYRIKYRVYDNEGATSEWQTSAQINL